MPQYKRKLKRGLRWYYSGQHLGIRYFSKAIYKTKQEAARAERKELEDIYFRVTNPEPQLKLGEVIETRLKELKLKKSRKYHKENERYFKILLEAVGDVQLSQVTKAQVREVVHNYASDLKRRKKTFHKANAMIRAYRALFNYADKLDAYGIRNPCDGIEFYSIDRKLKYIPSDDEITAVVRKCTPMEALLIEFVAQTGARINEALRFSREDLLADSILLYTRKSKNSNLTIRRVPIPDCIKDLNFKGRLFKRWTEQPRFLEKKVRELGQKPWAWHNLRHRYASRLSKEGRPLFEIMSLLGHSNLSTTQRYLQLLP